MSYNPNNPLIVQSDLTLLLETNSPQYDAARGAIAPFAEIVKTPGYVHTYRMTPISLWNAASAGLSSSEVTLRLTRYSRYEIPANIFPQIQELMNRYGQLTLDKYDDHNLQLVAASAYLMERFWHLESIRCYLESRLESNAALVKVINRGILKLALIKEGYPILDKVGYDKGADLAVALNPTTSLRDYQMSACESFLKGGSHVGGSGVVVLPCGAGKTIVGMGVMAAVKSHTLILVTNTTAARQWKRELLEKTTLSEEDIGEFSGERKETKPVTIATYQILTHRGSTEEKFTHFDGINRNPWGLIIYDEVHLLPAVVFRFTASLQSIRRLGLTATLIREDNKEIDVFSLIGPKNFDMAWKDVERSGWIAEAACFEIRVELDSKIHMDYAASPKRQRFRIASENPAKIKIVERLIHEHPQESILVIGQYIAQLQALRAHLGFPLITGETPQQEREKLFARFRMGELRVLIVSSVANFSIDLPDASVAIQISGKFGSRQEEAQRLGRILRPKAKNNQAKFFTIVTASTEEQEFALHRQLFLTEQGYHYEILKEDDSARIFARS